MIRIIFNVGLDSGYAHVFILLFVVIVQYQTATVSHHIILLCLHAKALCLYRYQFRKKKKTFAFVWDQPLDQTPLPVYLRDMRQTVLLLQRVSLTVQDGVLQKKSWFSCWRLRNCGQIERTASLWRDTDGAKSWWGSQSSLRVSWYWCGVSVSVVTKSLKCFIVTILRYTRTGWPRKGHIGL